MTLLLNIGTGESKSLESLTSLIGRISQICLIGLSEGDSSMIGLVVVCHEDMGTELVKAAEMIVGKVDAVATVSVKQESAPELLRDEVQAAIKKVDRKKGVMLFTDMFGGTPSNIALAFLGESIEVVTGVNLSMLIKFANHREEKSLSELARLVQEAAQKSIVIASQMLKGKK
jgi:PTS system mannose-specific IIA component